MLNLQQIHKPTTLQDALALLQQPGTVALGGGSQLLSERRRDVRAVVDLSALGLAYIRESVGTIVIGATTTLAALDESPMLRAFANGVLAQAAHRSASSILRNQATIAGTLISEPDGVLAVALLALDARVTVVEKETRTLALGEWLMEMQEMRQSLVTEIAVPMTNARASLQIVARTPSDKPIVCAVASARVENNRVGEVRVALGGIGATALRAQAMERALEGQVLDEARIASAAKLASTGLAPRGDFSTALRKDLRGSVEYRTEMAGVLARRAVQDTLG